MSRKRVISLRKIKKSGRYIINIKFSHRGSFLYQSDFDVTQIISENNWSNISFGESRTIFENLFNIDIGKYPIDKPIVVFPDGINNFCAMTESGYDINLTNEDLSKLRDHKLEKLGI
jgi:hypothetical protein